MLHSNRENRLMYSGGGNGMGFRAQLLFFLDELIPSLFGKPLLTDQPNRSLFAWH